MCTAKDISLVVTTWEGPLVKGNEASARTRGIWERRLSRPKPLTFFPLVIRAGSPTMTTWNKLFFYEILADGSNNGAVSFRVMFGRKLLFPSGVKWIIIVVI